MPKLNKKNIGNENVSSLGLAWPTYSQSNETKREVIKSQYSEGK